MHAWRGSLPSLHWLLRAETPNREADSHLTPALWYTAQKTALCQPPRVRRWLCSSGVCWSVQTHTLSHGAVHTLSQAPCLQSNPAWSPLKHIQTHTHPLHPPEWPKLPTSCHLAARTSLSKHQTKAALKGPFHSKISSVSVFVLPPSPSECIFTQFLFFLLTIKMPGNCQIPFVFTWVCCFYIRLFSLRESTAIFNDMNNLTVVWVGAKTEAGGGGHKGQHLSCSTAKNRKIKTQILTQVYITAELHLQQAESSC